MVAEESVQGKEMPKQHSSPVSVPVLAVLPFSAAIHSRRLDPSNSGADGDDALFLEELGQGKRNDGVQYSQMTVIVGGRRDSNRRATWKFHQKRQTRPPNDCQLFESPRELSTRYHRHTAGLYCMLFSRFPGFL